MKLFKKISIAVLSLILAISCGAFLKEIAPQKQVEAATNTYKYRYLSDLGIESHFNLWNNSFALNGPIDPPGTVTGAVTLKRGGWLVNETFTKAVVFNRNDATQEGGVVFNIAGLNATRITATIGINQTASYPEDVNAGIAKFRVYADNTCIYDSGIAYNRNGQYGNLDANIPNGTSKLKLVAYDDASQQSIICEHAVFANPRIYGVNLVGGVEGEGLDLSEMPYEYKEAIGWYDNIAINEAYPADGQTVPLSLRTANGNVNYDKGICIQANDDNTGAAPAKVSWGIEGINAYRFTATIGLNQRDGLGDDLGSVKFQVRFRIRAGADEVRYESKTFYRNTQAEEIDIPVPADATHIVLAVLNAGDGFSFDNGTFANPKLYCDFVRVSDMTAQSTSMGYGDLLYNDTMSGKATLYNMINEGTTVHSRHTYFDSNLFTHATSFVDFSVANMNATRFVCYVGITSTKLGSDGIMFAVHADGAELGHVVTAQYQQMAKIDVNIPHGARTITLSATSAVGDNNSDHGIWCAPMFFGNNMYGVKEISLTAENDSLTVGEESDFSAYSYTFDAKIKKLTNFTLTSDNTAVATVSGHTVKGVGEGSAKITINTTIDGINYTTWANIVVGSATSTNYKQMKVVSPDGNTQIVVTLNNGWIDYSASKNGKLFVEKSRMGVHTNLGENWYGYTFDSISAVRNIDDTYSTFSGKYAENRDYCTEQDITFRHSSGLKLKIIVRAYNDGVAFKYVVTGNGGQGFTMYDENTSITVPFFSTTWSSPMPENGGAANKQYTHEQPVTECLITSFNGRKVVPYMYKTPDGIYCLMSESDLDGDYWGSVLRSESIKTLRLGRSGQQTENLNVSSGTLEMPWRAFIAGSLEEVVKSVMIENLAPPADPSKDWSWVDTGVTSWSWMDGSNQFFQNGGDSKNGQTVNMKPINGQDYNVVWNYNNVVVDWQGNPEAIKMYIDLAAEMNWEYFILDMGWQPRKTVASAKDGNGLIDGEPVGNWQVFDFWFDGVYDWMTDKTQYHTATTGYTGEKIVDYAAKKGVKLIAWIHTGHIDTEKRMTKVFSMLKDLGIKGIKVDFFDSENQWTMDLYETLYNKTAEYELLGIFHGSNKPSGERRTYPHVINREAIPGEELNNTKVSQQSILAYLRGTVGPTDLTPYVYTVGSGDTNMASQMAFSIIYESGMTCFASTAAEYRALSNEVKYYFNNFPSRWADLKLISGEVGDKMSIARKTLDNKWYVGCITVDATTDTFNLDFLDSGKQYYAHIYTDKDNRRAVDYKKQTVTSQSSLTLSARANGGYVVVLEEIHECNPSSTYTYNKEQHWQTCTCGAEFNKAGHTYTKSVETPATCTTKGTSKYTCNCGYSYTAQDIEIAKHSFTKQDTDSKYIKSEATCEAKAVYYKCCETCGLSSKGQSGEATFTSGSFAEHKYGSWNEEIPAQVGVNGTKGHYNCSVCNKNFDMNYNEIADLTIPALNPPASSSNSSSSESSSSIVSSSSQKQPTPSRGGCKGNIGISYLLIPLMALAITVIVKKAKKR